MPHRVQHHTHALGAWLPIVRRVRRRTRPAVGLDLTNLAVRLLGFTSPPGPTQSGILSEAYGFRSLILKVSGVRSVGSRPLGQ